MAFTTRSGLSSARALVLNRPQLASQSQWISRVANNLTTQKRDISIQALDERKGGTSSTPTFQQPSSLLTQSHRPPTSNCPRLRLGRLLSLPRPRPPKVPNCRRISPVLLRLHTSPRLHLRRNARIPLRIGTRSRSERPKTRSTILSRLGGWCRLGQAHAVHRRSG
jgi:hypothetical protein